MNWDDFQASRKYIEEKALALMDHEGKPMVRAGFPEQNFRSYEKDGRTFFYVGTNTFKGIYEYNLVNATEQFPALLGTGNAYDVIDAINKVEPTYPDVLRMAKYLQEEQFGLFIENNNGKIEDRILRLDLFRQLDEMQDGKHEFTGGILHALKHFSYNNVPLSTGKQIHNLSHPTEIIFILLETFFFGQGKFINNTTYVCLYDYNEKYNLKVVYYHEPNTNVYFLKSIYPSLKPKPSAETIY
jgi:hypothetical protein